MPCRFQCLVGICCLSWSLLCAIVFLFVRFLASVAPINDGIDVCASARGHCLAWVVPQELDVAYEPAPTQEHSAWMLVCATHTLCSMQRMHFRLRSARVLVCAAHRSCLDAAHGFLSRQRIFCALRSAWVFACAAHGLLFAQRTDVLLMQRADARIMHRIPASTAHDKSCQTVCRNSNV